MDKQPLSSPERASHDQIMRQYELLSAASPVADLLHAMAAPVLLLNPAWQIVFANDRVLEHFPTPDLNSILGQRPGELLDCTHTAARHACCDLPLVCPLCGILRALQQAQQGVAAVEDCRLLRANGKALNLRVRATPITCLDIPLIVFTCLDIAEEKCRELLTQTFFHDIGNSVGIIRGATELLLTEKEREIKEKLRQMLLRAIRWLLQDVGMLQALLTAENGELQPRYEALDARALLQDLAELYATHQAAKDKHIHLRPEAEAVILWSDPRLLARVLGNLLKNALEATLPGGTVTLYCARVGDAVEFQVHNQAVMPPEVQAQIFQRAFSTKGSGRGIGAYSVKLLTEQYLHGTVCFQSQAGLGTIFTVTYPLIPD